MPVRIHEYPRSFTRFRCLADKCPESCCIPPDLPIERETYEKYMKLPGEAGRKIRDSIIGNDRDGWFIQIRENGRCPHLNDDNLCDIILEAGEEYLCVVCDTYPREHVDIEGCYTQDRLIPGCIEAASLMFEDPVPEFISETQLVEQRSWSEETEIRVNTLRVFRDGIIQAVLNGSYDSFLIDGYESDQEFIQLLLSLQGIDVRGVQSFLRRLKSIVEDDKISILREMRPRFIKEFPDSREWFRTYACFLLHRYLMNPAVKNDMDNQLRFVIRCVMTLELCCILKYEEDGSFSKDSLLECVTMLSTWIEWSTGNMIIMGSITEARKKTDIYREISSIAPYREVSVHDWLQPGKDAKEF